MTYTYIIIEDNPGALKNLQIALKEHEDFKEIGMANSAKKGIVLAQTLNPHIIFLDVELGGENGFDVLKEIRQFTGEIPFFVMTTDYDKYAKEAVNKDVLYFLEKPIDPDELAIALKKAERKFLDLQNHITIKNTEGHYFINLDSIQYIQADSNTCKIHRDCANPMLVTKTLKEIEKILPPDFLRIHKSYIVNRKFIKMLNTTKKMVHISINDDTLEIPIGNLYLEKVRNVLLLA